MLEVRSCVSPELRSAALNRRVISAKEGDAKSRQDRSRKFAGRLSGGNTLRIVTGFTLALLLGGCAGPGQSLIEAASPINQTRSHRWALIAGDTVSLKIKGKDEWAQQITIPSHGQIHFRGVDGEFQAIGSTVTELRDLALDKYGFLNDAEISVHLIQTAPRQIGVMGMVKSPGPVTLEDKEITLLEAIARAGGPTLSRARLTNLLLVRWDPINKRQLTWVVDARVDHWAAAPPLFLQPHDVIYVPNTPIDKANIWVDKYIRQMIPLPLPASAL